MQYGQPVFRYCAQCVAIWVRSATAVAAICALVQSQKQEESEQQAAQQTCTERLHKKLSALEAQLQAIHRDTAAHASNAAGTPAAGCKSAITLRLTDSKEEETEEADELLRRTAQVLDQLPNAVSPAGAIRQGAPGGNKAHAVIITLASEADRAMVLRTKAILGRNDDTSHLSLIEVLSPDQQRQKNALWSVFIDARIRAGEHPGEGAISTLMVRSFHLPSTTFPFHSPCPQ